MYFNERQVGEGIRAAGIDRSEIFVETKVWVSDYGFDQTRHAFDKAAGKLGLEQIDLLILHQPPPTGSSRRSGPTRRWRSCSPTARSGRSGSATSPRST